MSMFSLIELKENGKSKLLTILKAYNLNLEQDELQMLMYGCFPDRYDNYIPRVSRIEHRRLKELIKRERYFITSFGFKNGKRVKKKYPISPTSFKNPDEIKLKFGQESYTFSVDHSIQRHFSQLIHQFFLDFEQGKIQLITKKAHYHKGIVNNLIEYLKKLLVTKEIKLSENRLFHLVFDLMAIAFPKEFNVNQHYDDAIAARGAKASRIREIIK